MNNNQNYRPVLSILVLAWPVVVEMCLHTFVWIFDMAMVMRLGAREATAVEYGALIFFSTIMVCGALGIGANALVARYTGAGEMKKAALTGGQAISLGFLVMLALAALGFAGGERFFVAVIKDTVTASLAVDYFYHTLYSGGILLLPLLIINGIVRGTGNTRVPMMIALVANVYNVVGDYVLIFGHLGFPAMGVRGAAVATGSAQLLGCLLGLAYIFLNRKSIRITGGCLYPLRRDVCGQVFRLSAPAGAQDATRQVSTLLSATWITALGPVAFAANAAAIAAESFSFMPGYAFAISVTTLVGQRLGAGFPGQARSTGYWAAVLGTLFMTMIGFVFLLFPYMVMSLFDPPDPEVFRLGALCLRIAAVEQPFIALSMIFAGALRGAGDTRGPFKVELVSNLLIRLPLIYAVVFIFRLSVTYIWWVTALQYLVSAALMFRLFQRKKWDEITPAPKISTAV